jgi:hypothetical protein
MANEAVPEKVALEITGRSKASPKSTSTSSST